MARRQPVSSCLSRAHDLDDGAAKTPACQILSSNTQFSNDLEQSQPDSAGAMPSGIQKEGGVQMEASNLHHMRDSHLPSPRATSADGPACCSSTLALPEEPLQIVTCILLLQGCKAVRACRSGRHCQFSKEKKTTCALFGGPAASQNRGWCTHCIFPQQIWARQPAKCNRPPQCRADMIP